MTKVEENRNSSESKKRQVVVETMKVCVIGAGASGLPAIKSALEYGCKVICFEKSEDIGGLWRYKPNPCPGEGTVMKTTVINSSKEMSAYSDFPPPPEYANYMHNSQLLKYLRSYAAHFDLNRHIKFKHEVLNVRRASDFEDTGKWQVTWRDLTNNNSMTDIFDGVMVCTGHHTEEYWPAPFPGQKTFAGKIMHSHDYKDCKGFEDKRVVVVGIGNSGADISVELSKVASQVFLSTRSGAWVMNRVWDFGEPSDVAYLNRFTTFMRKMVPFSFENLIMENKLNARFDHGRFGLLPNHRVLEAHVTVNDELPNRIASGTVIVKPNIGSFTENQVVFDDGTEEDIDIVIFATGYSFHFPMLEEGKLIPVKENSVELYKNMYPLDLYPQNSLAVIGLIQPVGSIMPISEIQTRLFMAVLTENCKLPNREGMMKDIQHRMRYNAKFVKSRRHTIQVEYVDYMEDVAKLLGCCPKISSRWVTDPQLARVLTFHGQAPYQYRLDGPHKWDGARDALLGMEDRIFNTTRTRRTKETEKSKPILKVTYVYRAFVA